MSDIENLAGDTRPIGVFDSGLGGLTVARAIAQMVLIKIIMSKQS